MAKEQTGGDAPVEVLAPLTPSGDEKKPNPVYVPALRKSYDLTNLTEAEAAELKPLGLPA